MATITAIISAYYAHEYIGRRIMNLFSQVKPLEIIAVCQDGSREHEALSQYDVMIITTPDIPTIGKAWNLAIAQAEGDYITTANCDDMFTVGGLAMLRQALDDNDNVGLVFSAVNITDEQGTRPWYRMHTQSGAIPNMLEVLTHRCIIGAMPLWRRSLHDCLGYFDEGFTVASDYDMWLRMARAGVGFYYLSDICGTYENRADSLEHRNKEIMINENKLIRGRL
jgi:GT2 family glycosyltransferase